MYKLDNLFRSIRASDENSSSTRGFQFFKHILTQDFFCIQYAPFKATSSLFNPFLTSFAIFHGFMIYFELKWPWIEKHCKWTLEWYHHFTHIATAKELRGLQEKLDALRVQIGQSLSKYQGFGQKLIYYNGISFLKHILTQDFFCIQYAPFEATSSLFNPILTSFAIFHAFHDLFWARMTQNGKALQMNSEMVESWHGIIISPT